MVNVGLSRITPATWLITVSNTNSASLVTGLFRFVTAIVTGFTLVKLLMYKACDGVTAPHPKRGWGECQILTPKVFGARAFASSHARNNPAGADGNAGARDN
jgi:hypothetical protein